MKYPEDFAGWIPFSSFKQIRGHYLILVSPDGLRQACIHLEDKDVVGVWNGVSGTMIYEHPFQALGMIKLLRLMQEMEEALSKMYQRSA